MKDYFIKRVEGHGSLKIDLNKETARILVEEDERLFEQLVVNFPYCRAPFITARICGICSTAHYLASIKAIESAFNVQPSKTVVKLREALLAAQIVQSHTLHLFFLVLPDYLKTSSVKEMANKYPTEFNLGLNLKNITDKLVKTLGGREVHPLTPKVGGQEKAPSLGKITSLIEEIDSVIDKANDTYKLFNQLELPEIQQSERAYLSLDSNNYPLYQGEIITGLAGEKFKTFNYKKSIVETEREGTLVKLSQYVEKKKSKPIMVGALARLNRSSNQLGSNASKLLNSSKLSLPSFNPFDNILAQAIEINHYLETAKNKLSSINKNELENLTIKVKPKKGEGVGAVEAPRGVLYHYYRTDNKGNIVKADIITPTASFMISLEEDADLLIRSNRDRSQAELELLIEQLIRAYDPCLTCSVH
jgi:coenzyme F420-reducing hydrogenase alpha subunit